MKKCYTCGESKLLSEFYNTQSICKKCRNIYSAKYRKDKLVLPYTIIYLLPVHNYIGITNNPTTRMSQHKTSGHDITGWIEIARYSNRRDAEFMELKLHRLGYVGSNRLI